jgi:hypothetical protein
MTEKPSNYALIIVHISNDERLNAEETEDFFLFPFDQFDRAEKLLRDIQNHKKHETVNTLSAVKKRLTDAKITFEIIEHGARVYLGMPQGEEKEDAS